MMTAVVARGTGTAAQIPGVAVAGKTGTAETGVAGRNTVWFISFAPADDPKVAVAVVVEATSGTGGAARGPDRQGSDAGTPAVLTESLTLSKERP